MKLLFITYDFYPNFSANSFIINNLSQVLIEIGHEVDVLPLKPYSNDLNEEIWNDICIHRITNTFDKKQVKEYLHKYQFAAAFQLLFTIFKDRFHHKEYLKRHWSYYPLKRFKDILQQRSFDVVINVCYPFESCLPIMQYIEKYQKNFKWIIYMQDPFASNYYYLDKYQKEDLNDFQTKGFQMADKIIVTSAIMQEIKTENSKVPLNKFKVLNFPIIKKIRRTLSYDDIVFHRHYVNCVYVGKFNKDTRNPKVLFHMFEMLKREHIRLHIIGEEKEKWIPYLTEEDSNIFFYGMKSKEVSTNAELNANILINIGNSVSNQLPSKILEYISTGKPIVNLYKVEDCPTLEYTLRYPYCFNIFEPSVDQRTLKKLQYFCIKYRNVNVNYRYIRKRYFDSTVDYVSYEFMNLCMEMVNNNQQII